MADHCGVMPARYNITYYYTLLIGDIYSSKRYCFISYLSYNNINSNLVI